MCSALRTILSSIGGVLAGLAGMYYLYYLPIRNGDRKERIAATEEADLLGLISSEITLTFLALWIGVAASNLLPWAHRHISQLIADRMLE